SLPALARREVPVLRPLEIRIPKLLRGDNVVPVARDQPHRRRASGDQPAEHVAGLAVLARTVADNGRFVQAAASKPLDSAPDRPRENSRSLRKERLAEPVIDRKSAV